MFMLWTSAVVVAWFPAVSSGVELTLSPAHTLVQDILCVCVIWYECVCVCDDMNVCVCAWWYECVCMCVMIWMYVCGVCICVSWFECCTCVCRGKHMTSCQSYTTVSTECVHVGLVDRCIPLCLVEAEWPRLYTSILSLEILWRKCPLLYPNQTKLKNVNRRGDLLPQIPYQSSPPFFFSCVGSRGCVCL